MNISKVKNQFATQIIAKHLSNETIIPTVIAPDESICAFSGRSLQGELAVKKRDVLSSNFTDTSMLRYASQYLSLDIAKCMQPLSTDGRASLRNYSFMATDDELIFLTRENIFQHVTQPPKVPFVLVVTYNGKKHIAYRATVQHNTDRYTAYTDTGGDVIIHRADLEIILPIVKSWYSVVPEKATTAMQPTWFTKEEIFTGTFPMAKIDAYESANRLFFDQVKVMNPYFKTPLLRLIKFIIPKFTTHVESKV